MYEYLFVILWWTWWLLPLFFTVSRFVVYNVTFVFLLLLAGVATLGDYKKAWYPKITVVRDAELYLGPSTKYRTCGKIAAETAAYLLQQRAEWYNIATEQYCGWVHDATLSTERFPL